MARSRKQCPFSIPGVLLLAVAFLGGCETLKQNIEEPTVKLAAVALMEAGLTQQVYGLTLQVDNPNGFTLPIKGVKYAVKLGGQEFATGIAPSGFSIPAKGSEQIRLEVRTNLLESIGHLGRLLSGGSESLDYELTGDIRIAPIGTIPFAQSGTIPLTRGSGTPAL